MGQRSRSPADSTLTALGTIGNTPLVKLQKLVPKGSADIYVKLEYFNPTGSKKDRMALAMIEGAEKRGELRPGMSVIEYTGGSTGSSLACARVRLAGLSIPGYWCISSHHDAGAYLRLDARIF